MKKKYKILVVEDNKSSATVLMYMLKTLNYITTGVAESAEQTIELIEKEMPDLILMDIMIIGDKDGIETAVIVQEQYDIPVIFLTALSDDRTIQKAKNANPYGYISKPFEMRDLKGTIEFTLNKRELEAQIKEKEIWFKYTLNNIDEAVITVDDKNNVLFINVIGERLLGYKHHEMENKSIDEFLNIVPDFSTESLVFLSHGGLSHSDHKFAVCKMLVDRDGKNIPIEDSFSIITDHKGNVKGKVITVRDITKRREAFLANLRAKDFYLGIFEKFPVLIWRSNSSGQYNYFNNHWLQYTGVDINSQIFTGWYELIHEDDKEKFATLFESSVKTKTRIETEFRLLNNEKEYHWLMCMAEPFDDINGNFDGFIGVCFDITGRKLIEEELIKARNISESASTNKTNFIANMSHEIRTPLNGIMGLTDLILDTDINIEQKEYLEMIKQSSYTLLNLLNNLLNYSKIERNKDSVVNTEFELQKIVEEIAMPYKTQAKKRGIDFKIEIDEGIPKILIGDSQKIQQILSNLLSNADKFTERGEIALLINIDKLVNLLIQDNNIFIHIVVKDTGIGIEKCQHNNIFQSFTQVDGSKTRRYSGSGLGLSLVKKMVEQMNGKVWFESEYGKGSSFHCVIEIKEKK